MKLLQERFPGQGWQTDAAKRIWGEESVGSMQPQISRWTRGRSHPNPQNAVDLADFLGVRLRYLLTGEYPIREADPSMEAAAFQEIAAVVDRVRNGTSSPAKSPSNTKAARARKAKGQNEAGGAKKGTG